MLAIRLQRVGRKGHAMYRMAVQESQRHPSSGRVVAYVGTYDPHTKDAKVQVEIAQKYLDNGAQPSPRVVKLLKDAGVKLPKWVTEASDKKSKTIRNAEKLRKNQPKVEAVKEEKVEEVVEKKEVAEVQELVEVEKAEETTEPAVQE
ncbi:MAG: 30S ribosomal protein S16 [Candidatus Saccharibacteria bacterium]